jgi:L-gulonolactone oxidase
MSAFRRTEAIKSWGRVQNEFHWAAFPHWRDEISGLLHGKGRVHGSVLAMGKGRSYGDSNLNASGRIVDMTRLNRLIAFDRASGLLRAEAGLSLADLIAFSVPRGYYPPVVPGTSHVTLGGMVANDVHGKNHHSAGTIGRWVTAIELARSDGSHLRLAPSEHADLFSATIGGLGLTGAMTEIEIRLRPIQSAEMVVEDIPFGSVESFFALTRESEDSWEYTVAWIDCISTGNKLGRGIFTRARHATDGGFDPGSVASPLLIPVDLPRWVFNGGSIKLFNELFWRMKARKPGARRQSLAKVLFPLDSIGQWNRMYGSNGMYQYQCVVPPERGFDAVHELLSQTSAAGEGSFLAVLKNFGGLNSPGMLSFPRAGVTLALDLPNRGARTLALMARLDRVVGEAGGRLYPAKDGRMPGAIFKSGYPNWEKFAVHVDPDFSSGFWRRVMAS